MKRRMLPILLSLALCLSLLPTAALAAGVEEGVPYIYYTWNNGLERHSGTVTATVVTASDTEWNSSTTGGWYVAQGEVTIDSIEVKGDVHLILQDGCSLTVNDSIRVTDNGFNSGYPPQLSHKGSRQAPQPHHL
ncbi:hypothetical protein [Evtepia sp.]